MTIKDLCILAVVNDWEDAEITINYECDGYWYSLEDVPIEEEILHYDKGKNRVYINL